jgi:tape measure domain-containing protein
MSEQRLNLNVHVNSADARRDLAATGRELGSLGNKGKLAGDGMASLAHQVSSAKMQLLGLAGAASMVEAGRGLIEMADEYKNLEAKLRLVTKSQTEYLDVQTKLMAMADANRQSVSATISLYSGIAPSLQKAGKSQADVLKVVDSVNKALVVGGSNAQGSAASILQLTQALGSGVLRGDEFNSIMENGRGIAMMLADALHTDVGKLRSLAEQGKLTADVVSQALLEQHDAVAEKFAKMPVTVGQAMQVVKNNLLAYVGSTDSASGATSALSGALMGLSGNLSTVANVVGVIATIYAGRGLAALTGYTAAKMAAVAAGRAKIATDAQEAVAAATQSAATSRAAVVQRQAAVVNASMSAQAALANKEAASTALLAARGTDGYGAAVRRMQAAHVGSTTASAAAAVARTEYTAATHAAATAEIRLAATQASAARATGVMAAAMRGLSGAMALVGGPIGLLVVAIAGIAYGLKHLVDEEEKAKDAIKDSSGEWLKYADITDKAKQLNVEYTTASKSKKKAIEDELKALNATTEAEIKSAAATLGTTQAKLASLKVSNQRQDYTASYVDDEGNLVADSNEASKSLENAYQRDIDQQIAKLQELNAGLQGVTHEQKNLGTATDDASTKTDQSALSLLGAGKASKEAAKALHDHGDALKSVVESLQKQRIELKHGKLAAEYYTDRINGLTDAEARAKAGASQYNSLLEERKRLQTEAAGLSGSLVDKYQAHLQDIGLDAGAMAGIDAAKASTDRAVTSANQYKSAIDSATESLKRQEEAAKAAGTGAVASFSAQTAGIQQIAGAAAASAAQVVGKLQALGWSKNQAVGIAANLKQESEFLPSAVGDSGHAYGMAQWHEDRQANFSRAMGKGIQGSSVDDQLKFVTYELTKGSEKGAGKKLQNASSAAEAAAIISRYYERPAATAEEMTRRAGIANGIAKSLGDAVPTFRAVAEETGKVAPAAAKALPVLGNLTTATTSIKDVTVEYNGAMDAARVTAKDTTDLLQSSLNNEMNTLLKTATEQTLQAKLTGAEYRQHELDVMMIGAERAKTVMTEEQLANYTKERVKIEEDAANVRNGMAAQYTAELKKQNLSQEQISDLVSRKMANETAKLLKNAQDTRQQLLLTPAAYQAMTMAADGFSQEQIAQVQHVEKLNEELKRIRETADKVGEDLLSALTNAAMGGQDAFKGLEQTLKDSFASLVLKPTIEPLTKAVSAGINGTLTGQANPWASLQQQMSQTWSGLQQGGMQGYTNAAGIGATIGGLTGSQEGAIGGSLGSMAGKALGTALGGPIGGAIGSVIGSAAGAALGDMLKDDDSARAKFTNGAPVDGFVNRDGNKLSATSKYGTFGFQEDGTHDLGNAAEKEMAAFVQRMASVDNALSEFIPASETARITAELAGFQHSGLDFAELFKQRLVVITSGLSETMRSLIDYSQDADGILSRINDLIAIQKEAVPALRNMNMQIGATDDAALAAAAGLADAAGGLQNLTTVASAYYSAVYSEEEQKQNSIRTAQAAVSAFNAANNTQISSLASLRQYVEGLDITNPAAQKASLAAMGLADELQLLAPAIVAANTAVSSVAIADTSVLDSANAKLAEQQAVFGLFNDSLSGITSGLDRQLSQLENSYRDQIAAFGKAQDAAHGLRDALLGLHVSDATTLTPEQQLAEARKQFADLQAAASSGDINAASKLESAGDALLRLSREYNASSVDYSNDFAAVANGWSSVADLLENQRDPQQDMLDAQKSMVQQATNQAAQMAAVYGGIIGGNNLLTMLGTNINSLPPDIANALKSVLDGIAPKQPEIKELTKSEYQAKANSDASSTTSPTAQLATIYQTLLGRAIDTGGLNYWLEKMAQGTGISDVISSILSSTEFSGKHPNSHATGLDYVPYDDYKANLHRGEAVIDAASMNAMRKYGIPLQSRSSGGNIVVNVDMQALVSKVESLTAEVRSLRSERSQDAQSAAQQRSAHIQQSSDTERGVIRAVKMRGGR